METKDRLPASGDMHDYLSLARYFWPDFSSFHVVDYDPETGDVRQKCTAQGFSDDSFWSRGQAWGLYGYTMCYRFTGDPAYLRQAEGIADFILSLPDMPEDLVPYWDMKAPGVAGSGSDPMQGVPRDASAAAITASGLYELSTFVAADKAATYKAADRMTDSLGESYQAPPGTALGFLLLHSTGYLPAGSEIDVPICYADYYYLEAVMRRDAWPQLNL